MKRRNDARKMNPAQKDFCRIARQHVVHFTSRNNSTLIRAGNVRLPRLRKMLPKRHSINRFYINHRVIIVSFTTCLDVTAKGLPDPCRQSHYRQAWREHFQPSSVRSFMNLQYSTKHSSTLLRLYQCSWLRIVSRLDKEKPRGGSRGAATRSLSGR